MKIAQEHVARLDHGLLPLARIWSTTTKGKFIPPARCEPELFIAIGQPRQVSSQIEQLLRNGMRILDHDVIAHRFHFPVALPPSKSDV